MSNLDIIKSIHWLHGGRQGYALLSHRLGAIFRTRFRLIKLNQLRLTPHWILEKMEGEKHNSTHHYWYWKLNKLTGKYKVLFVGYGGIQFFAAFWMANFDRFYH